MFGYVDRYLNGFARSAPGAIKSQKRVEMLEGLVFQHILLIKYR